jgi:hypothetical protein
MLLEHVRRGLQFNLQPHDGRGCKRRACARCKRAWAGEPRTARTARGARALGAIERERARRADAPALLWMSSISTLIAAIAPGSSFRCEEKDSIILEPSASLSPAAADIVPRAANL